VSNIEWSNMSIENSMIKFSKAKAMINLFSEFIKEVEFSKAI
jgi:hypothetical protein